VPVAHGEGNYAADPETVARLEDEGRVLFRYTSPDGKLDEEWNYNGATNAIAGVLSEKLNVLGLMPHPENHVDPIVGPVDGRGFFESIRATLEAA
jgi:phosphoribosylformylglycinamidine synthase